MKVADGMSERVLMIGPAHTLREAARMMAARNVGAAVVVNPEHSGVGILTERDILNSVAAGESPDTETAGQHCTQDLVFASREWTLEDAAAAMVHGGFRHLVVVEAMRSSACCPCGTSSASGHRSASRPRPSRAGKLSRATRPSRAPRSYTALATEELLMYSYL